MFCGFPVAARSWPTKPVKLVVGFSAGGPTDVVARGFAEHAAKSLGQPVIVDNKPGANTIIAAETVAAASDGLTLLMAATNHTMIPALYSRQVKFDAVRSFKPICTLAVAPTILVVGSSMQAKSLKEFIQLAKDKPREITYGTPGIGSSGHFFSEQFAQLADIRMMHVPYKGASLVITDLIAGHVDASFATLGSVIQYVKAGKLRALAIATPDRLSELPDVPTFAEMNFQNYTADAWYGLLAPAAQSDAQVNILQKEAIAWATSPAGAEKLRVLGMEPKTLCGEAFTRQIAEEVTTNIRIAREIDLKME
jgi:tripartite-type tricarboxylate transporter receptor subunit TctC